MEKRSLPNGKEVVVREIGISNSLKNWGVKEDLTVCWYKGDNPPENCGFEYIENPKTGIRAEDPFFTTNVVNGKKCPFLQQKKGGVVGTKPG